MKIRLIDPGLKSMIKNIAAMDVKNYLRSSDCSEYTHASIISKDRVVRTYKRFLQSEKWLTFADFVMVLSHDQSMRELV